MIKNWIKPSSYQVFALNRLCGRTSGQDSKKLITLIVQENARNKWEYIVLRIIPFYPGAVSSLVHLCSERPVKQFFF